MEKEYYKSIDGKLYLKNLNGEFEITDIEASENELENLSKNFEKFDGECQKIFDKIETTQNKGSYLAKVILLIQELTDLKVIGDKQLLFDKLNRYKEEIQSSVENNRIRNGEIKSSLIKELSQIVDENNFKASNEVKEILQKWIKVGKAVEDQEDELNRQFEALKLTFYQQRSEFIGTQKELTDSRVQAYRLIIKELEEIVEAKKDSKNQPRVAELLQEWKEVGNVPVAVYQSLWVLFKKNLDDFYTRYKSEKLSKGGDKSLEKEILGRKKEVLNNLKQYSQETERVNIKKLFEFKDQWNQAGKVSGKILGKVGDEYYDELEYLFEKSNLQNYNEKKNFGLDHVSLLKTIKRFIVENQDEINQFKENQEAMNIQMSSGALESIFNKRLIELEKKLKAKKRILEEISQKV